MGEALVYPVRNSTVVVEGSEDVFHGLEHVVDTDHIQKGLLLTGKRGIRQVFGRRAGANRERHFT